MSVRWGWVRAARPVPLRSRNAMAQWRVAIASPPPPFSSLWFVCVCLVVLQQCPCVSDCFLMRACDVPVSVWCMGGRVSWHACAGVVVTTLRTCTRCHTLECLVPCTTLCVCVCVCATLPLQRCVHVGETNAGHSEETQMSYSRGRTFSHALMSRDVPRVYKAVPRWLVYGMHGFKLNCVCAPVHLNFAELSLW